MLDYMFPFWASLCSLATAQILKPVFYYLIRREWYPLLALTSGGFPSSHTAMVSALSISVGLQDSFNSTAFVITLVLTLIVAYDAANVRYYAGQNIQITQQLIKDLKVLSEIKLDDPIYLTRVKDVLGHKWTEVIGGCLLGASLSFGLYSFLLWIAV